MNEIWKPVLSFEDIYEVSNLGRIRKISTKRCLKSRIYVNKNVVNLVKTINDVKIKFYQCFVDSIVIQSFLGVCYTRCNSYIQHKNNNLLDDSLDNLSYHIWGISNVANLYDLFYINVDEEIFIKRSSMRDIARYLKISSNKLRNCINKDKVIITEDCKVYKIKIALI